MKITIKTIAMMAGVHRSTVDKVIHRRPGVSDEVRARIQAIIDEVDYQPNHAGMALRKQTDHFRIAVVVREIDALPFFKAGVEKAKQAYRSYNIAFDTYVVSNHDPSEQAKILRQLREEKVNGIAIYPLGDPCVGEEINAMVAEGIPTILVNTVNPHVGEMLCYVGQDMYVAGQIAARLMGEFFDHKAGKVALLVKSNDDFSLEDRGKGFQATLQQAFPQIEIIETVETFENPELSYVKTLELLDKHPALYGIYVTCGGAVSAGRALKERGRTDIKLVTHECYKEIVQLLHEDVINCSIDSDLTEQSFRSLQILCERLIFNTEPPDKNIYTLTSILFKENASI